MEEYIKLKNIILESIELLKDNSEEIPDKIYDSQIKCRLELLDFIDKKIEEFKK